MYRIVQAGCLGVVLRGWFLLLFILLFAALFLMAYVLAGGPLPGAPAVRSAALRLGLPGACAAAFFLLGAVSLGFLTGLAWTVLGWFLPVWAKEFTDARNQARLRSLAGDFVTSASGMFSAGQTAGEVVRVVGEKFAEPLGSDFREMSKQYRLNPRFSFPRAFEALAERRRLPEFRAVAAILNASSVAGGPRAAGKGLAQLGFALRQRDKLLAERAKATVEVKIAGYVVAGVLLAGLVADATALREYYSSGGGRLAAAAASAVAVGLAVALQKITKNKDLEGGDQ